MRSWLRRSGVVALALSTTFAVAGMSGTALASTKKVTTTKTTTTKTTTTKTTTKTAAVTPMSAPSGQTTLTGLLSSAASTFGSVLTGWTSYGGALVAQTLSVGRTGMGALSVTSAVRGPERRRAPSPRPPAFDTAPAPG